MIKSIEKVAREHQVESCDVTYKMIMDDVNCHPIIGLPTGAGKSLVIAMLIDKIMSHNPRHNILILCDRKEILAQDHEELVEYYQSDIGLVSSGLDVYDIQKITVAGIQSIFRKKKDFEKFDFVIIDECDSVNEDNKSMYRSFLKQEGRRYIGLTATPYGLKGGYLYEGENALFTCMSVDYTRGEKYLSLVDKGYIANIIPFPTSVIFDEKKLKTLAGDYSTKSQSENFDLEHITRAAMMEIIHCGKNFRRWLLFTIDIKHAENIGKMLTDMGISNCVIHSKLGDDKRDQLIAESKTGKYKAVVNVDILTIGYNDPGVDLIALLYCTKSPRKHVQAPGRLRPDIKGIADYKEHKVVLDFGGNFKRMGPLNAVKIKKLGVKEEGKSGPMMKDCPQCKALNHLSAKFCINCEFEFLSAVKVTKNADSSVEMIKRDFESKQSVKGWADVSSITYSRHKKTGSPDCVKVEYKCGMLKVVDWINIEHNGYPLLLAKNWIRQRWNSDLPAPSNVDKFLENTDYFAKETAIYIDRSGKYPKVVDSRFE